MKNKKSEAYAYQHQAKSDRDIAELLKNSETLDRITSENFSYRCYIIAMCQQAVEKSVKSLYILLGAKPARIHDVSEYILRMVRGPQYFNYATEVKGNISKLFTNKNRNLISRLYDLVPKSIQKDPDQNHRNTEYPFIKNGNCIPPCDPYVFNKKEMIEIFEGTRRIVDGIERIRLAIQRAKGVR